MALYCTFNSRREASSTIGNTAKQRGIQLFERPWNFYEPDNMLGGLYHLQSDPHIVTGSFSSMRSKGAAIFFSVVYT